MHNVKSLVLGLISFMVTVGLLTIVIGLVPSLGKHSIVLGVIVGARLLPLIDRAVRSKLK